MAADELANLAALLADRTRAHFLLSLLDGRAWTSGELARAAGVSPPTASEHLTRLVRAGLLVERRQGRHRYLQLAGPREADLLEHLLTYVGPTAPGRTLRAATASAALARGRTCYDHLAGRLGVAITDAMVGRRLLDDSCALTPAGAEWLGGLGADFSGTRRPVARACLDWTERRSHLAGAAGAHLCAHLHERGWVRRSGTGRAVVVTGPGRAALGRLLGLSAL
ncbi:winged helix-turn-helix domain-containing protein [Actinosynnema sp. NPDC050436]|uniref:ArsR/SmtB family transcription factor n=1 Tax=Actinosynnema sp. NPDC050436 TaxID=3155659 RepID=UPI0033E747E1